MDGFSNVIFRHAFQLLALSLFTFAAHAQTSDPLLAMPSHDTSSLTSTDNQARGILIAVEQATLSSELAGRIVEIPFREGESFKKGDLLVRFDCSIYQAQLAAASAATRAAEAELSQNQQLAQMKSVGRHAVSLSAAHFAQAQAESQVYQIQVNRCRITAPFDGQVVKRRVQAFESVAQGAPLLDVVNNRHLEINLLVPSRLLSVLKPGLVFTFTPDETGKPLQAKVTRLGARIDESSQTLGLIGTLAHADNTLMAGMSGTAQFSEAR
ncbi:efflux RND transporter periplasmic adaptor subunit [Pectobacterium carotovorum]|uniref:efflux RND transporter periplasmic adaptor subunit n=1 Tax=Pectobacterium carotovorum TaxID=554 RepID=UPI0001A4437D|nr:efflux RND transporter periplasmic adaptor subunit [Pectobacterium carotovorum]MDK9422046.1 efflux RND transporter periplasmic adaptor subunit [Pectobacterium carotovorum]QHP56471.1 efflux RND transporter periplasmic adaptor subunit [Pectobacterium carotovorum subsp. carotovorum]QLL94892.1 efflux RND transporter periplasmic adaptor subunit [Pectobacterium carotovorum]